MEIIVFLLWIVLPITLYVTFLIAVAKLAERYGRSEVGYVVLGLFLSPLTALVLLLCLGEDEYKKAERFEDEWKFIHKTIVECEQERKLKESKKINSETQNPPQNFENSKTINDLYKK